ncbi:hypothetical protein BKA67DRAFT_541826 [Truncatella angustata]|uniref:Uncharacterized protein n=1 Tax=Truncatella angustata TaxID=152316 RepID=A0A9P8RJW9_9PEZI|nr:uncharacterized protein BKA67DRAFT_541826 [Truncatella angustata]KAH6645643.1 hypothetical protein BKA67DRAFT_541826 [Truncatella angustata]
MDISSRSRNKAEILQTILLSYNIQESGEWKDMSDTSKYHLCLLISMLSRSSSPITPINRSTGSCWSIADRSLSLNSSDQRSIRRSDRNVRSLRIPGDDKQETREVQDNQQTNVGLAILHHAYGKDDGNDTEVSTGFATSFASSFTSISHEEQISPQCQPKMPRSPPSPSSSRKFKKHVPSSKSRSIIALSVRLLMMPDQPDEPKARPRTQGHSGHAAYVLRASHRAQA